MIDVVAMGELLIDFAEVTADKDGYPTVAAHPGGAPANFLAAVTKCGGKTALLGKVGADRFGDLLIRTLDRIGIETSGVVKDSGVFTTLAFVTFDETGDRDFSFARKPGADTCLTYEELDLTLVDRAKVFHFGSLSLTDEPAGSATKRAVAYAKEKGKLISYDPNLRKPLWKDLNLAKEQILWGLSQADVVKISDEEVAFLFDMDPVTGAEYIRKAYGAKLVYVTCGEKGCYYNNGAASGHVPALPGIQVIDTTGAGDIFGGCAAWKLMQSDKKPEELTDEELRDIVTFASAGAGLSTTKAGGISSVPELPEIMNVQRDFETKLY